MVKGDTFRPVVTVLKTKGDAITKIAIDGQEYTLLHKDHINGNKSKSKKQ